MNTKWSIGNKLPIFILSSFVWGTFLCSKAVNAEEGVTDSEIKIGTILSVEGRSRALGEKMLKGMEVAFAGKKINGKKLTLLSRNDSNNLAKTVAVTKELLDEGVLLLLGNVGKPTSKEALSLLAENRVPSIIFFYKLETSSVINNALKSGIKPEEVCAYVQNDTHGMSGVLGMRKAFQGKKEAEQLLSTLDDVLIKDAKDKPIQNNVGPVGVYTRDTFKAREGYESLKR